MEVLQQYHHFVHHPTLVKKTINTIPYGGMDWMLTLAMAVYVLYTVHALNRMLSGTLVTIPRSRACAGNMLTRAMDASHLEVSAALQMNHIDGTVDDMKKSWGKMLGCVRTVSVYANNYTLPGTGGYVYPLVYNNTMWVNAKHWDQENLFMKVRLVLHECSHLTLSTRDYKYAGDVNFTHLRGPEARNNADTITMMLMDIGQYRC